MANKGTSDDPMVDLTVRIPRSLRDKLRLVWHQSGYTMSQQARFSLTLWLKRVYRDPLGANGVLAGLTGPVTVQHGHHKGAHSPTPAPWSPIPGPGDPEPDPATDPAAWAKWSARQGNAAIAELASQHWPVTHTDD